MNNPRPSRLTTRTQLSTPHPHSVGTPSSSIGAHCARARRIGSLLTCLTLASGLMWSGIGTAASAAPADPASPTPSASAAPADPGTATSAPADPSSSQTPDPAGSADSSPTAGTSASPSAPVSGTVSSPASTESTTDTAPASPAPSASAPTSTIPVTPVQVQTRGSVTTSMVAVPQATGPASNGATLVAALPASSADQFNQVGLRWTSLSGTAAMFVRTHTAAGWSGWYDLSPEDANSASSNSATDPIYVENSDAVEVQVTGDGGTSLSGLQLVLIASAPQPADTATKPKLAFAMTQLAASNYVAQPTMVTRAQWGAYAPDPSGGLYIDDTIYGIVVHHTAGSNNYTAADVPGILRGIQSYHEYTLGWGDIGYNYLIDKFGTIYEGRSGGLQLPIHGAHATYWNDDTAGVSVMMNSGDGSASAPRVDPSPAVITAIAKVAAWKLAGNYRDPQGMVTLYGKTVNTIFRHGDVMATACPGLGITPYMSSIRSQAAAIMAGKSETEIKRYWLSQGGDSGWLGSPYRMEDYTLGNTARYTVFDNNAAVYYSESTGVNPVKGAIYTYYRSVGAENSALGLPISGEISARDGVYQKFQGGIIAWAPTRAAIAVTNGMATALNNAGGVTALGLPVSVEKAAADGVYQTFQSGLLAWSPNRPSYSVTNGMFTALQNAGGPAVIGLPVSTEQATSNGARQSFSFGAIYWTPSGSFVVRNGIYAAYQNAGADTGSLGLPTGNETATAGGATQSFRNGIITWSNATGSATVKLSSTNTPATPITPMIQATVGYAQAAMQQFGVPASVSLAQAILESNSGNSLLPIYGHAFFGIKCSTSTSPYSNSCINKSSAEYINGVATTVVSPFRAYSDAGDSFLDHGYFLKNSPRYAAAFNYTGNPDQFITEVAKAGYATDPAYTGKVIDLMKKYDLYQFDNPANQVQPLIPGGGIGTVWSALGGSSSPLGNPMGGEIADPVSGKPMVSFAKGVIVWDGSQSLALYGKPWNSYRMDADLRTALGAVTGNQASSGQYSQQSFAKGAEYWTASTAAVPVSGDLYRTFQAAGGVQGPLGLPSSAASSNSSGQWQAFAGGHLAGTGTNIQSVRDGMLQIYSAGGAETGRYGLPTGPELSDGKGGAYQVFTAAVLRWTPGGAFTVTQGMLTSYRGLGGPAGSLGMPTSNEIASGKSVYQTFTGGVLTWSPSGAYYVFGGVMDRYTMTGGPKGWLGLPSSNEIAVSGGVYQNFAGGIIGWTPGSAGHSVGYGILTAYQAAGGAAGKLGLPTSEEIPDGKGGVYQTFTGGRITWSPSAGTGIQLN